MIATGEIVGLAEWIIDDAHVLYFLFLQNLWHPKIVAFRQELAPLVTPPDRQRLLSRRGRKCIVNQNFPSSLWPFASQYNYSHYHH